MTQVIGKELGKRHLLAQVLSGWVLLHSLGEPTPHSHLVVCSISFTFQQNAYVAILYLSGILMLAYCE